jgi:cellulose synthase/poly-beta-1,6-N-acetylglucosamine synthase-like glycosyltransferase
MNYRQLEMSMSVEPTTEPQSESVARLSNKSEDTVSVVIPCYNEERYIGKALEQLADQFAVDQYELVIVDGMSEDNTRGVIEDFKKKEPNLVVRIVDNPARNIPTALNLGISAAKGNIIARMDAHAVPCSGYIRRCVEVLNQETAGAVGMPCLVRAGADTTMAQAIAMAVSHPFGIGDAKYRLGAGGPLQEAVDTVAFACFRKSLWQELGGFNENLLTNEDYDFNYRVRQSGRDVILDRSGHCDYFARTTLGSLATQYWRYGGWKAEMIRLHPTSVKLRHVVAPAFVLSLIALVVASVLWSPARWLLLVDVLLYLIAALAASWRTRIEVKRFQHLFLMPIVFATIHFTWGMSFILRSVSFRKREA